MILIGYSGHGYVAYGILQLTGKVVTGYCDKEEKTYNPFKLEYKGRENSPAAYDLFREQGFFISVGDNNIRANIFQTLAEQDLYPANAIHPFAIIDATAVIASKGVLIAGNATINPLSRIGKGVICNTGSIIEHECIVGDFAHLAPGVVLCGNVKVGNKSFIGANAVIRQGITIGNNAIIGAGAVVVRDVSDNSKVMGVPAR